MENNGEKILPCKFTAIIRKSHTRLPDGVCVGDLFSYELEVSVGVKQGCVLAPTIFNFHLTVITILALHNLGTRNSTNIKFYLDDDLFNLQRLKFPSKTRTTHIFTCSMLTIMILLHRYLCHSIISSMSRTMFIMRC